MRRFGAETETALEEGGTGMGKERVRITDIAKELGLSAATVSNVIHGKTWKASAETVRRVQELIEKRGYVPSMAGILLAQNDSRILGVVIHDHEKYEGHVLEDGFIAASVNALSREMDRTGYFMMVKVTDKWDEIVRFASMWNMEGLVMIGFCEQDYQRLREAMHIPFVVYDGYFQEASGICNLIIDSRDGGRQMGTYLKRMGHERVLCISDNLVYMDAERIEGCQEAMGEGRVQILQVPMSREVRRQFYQDRMTEILTYTAVFAMSDYYALELIHDLQEQGVRVPDDISVAGFDDCLASRSSSPPLTTVRQDADMRARNALLALRTLKSGEEMCTTVRLPVSLVERKSVRDRTKGEDRWNERFWEKRM